MCCSSTSLRKQNKWKKIKSYIYIHIYYIASYLPLGRKPIMVVKTTNRLTPVIANVNLMNQKQGISAQTLEQSLQNVPFKTIFHLKVHSKFCLHFSGFVKPTLCRIFRVFISYKCLSFNISSCYFKYFIFLVSNKLSTPSLLLSLWLEIQR